MATRKTVDQILDKAADILEKDGWVTGRCYDSRTGGMCALGAIARAAYPKAPKRDLQSIGMFDRYVNGQVFTPDPRHTEAVEFLAGTLDGQPSWRTPMTKVYVFNDELPSGIDYDDYDNLVVDEKVNIRSSKKVVAKLRNAAKAYRKQQEKA